MKKLMLVCIFTLSMVPTSSHAHDFAYYEQKTRELMPILGISPFGVNFTMTRKTPTIEQRRLNPFTIFINIERLNGLSEACALFECAVAAQCTTLDWSKIRYTPVILTPCGRIAVMSPLGITIYLLMDEYTFKIKGMILGTISFSILIAAIPTAAVMLFELWLDLQRKDKSELALCHHLMLAKLMDTIYALVSNQNTAYIGFAGLQLNLGHIPAHYYHAGPEANLIEDVVHTKQRIILKLNKWIHAHPDQWQDIKSTLLPTTVALFDTPYNKLCTR